MSSWGLWGLDRIASGGSGYFPDRAIPIPPSSSDESYTSPDVAPEWISRSENRRTIPDHPDGPDGLWHGTPSGDLRGSYYGLHVGTYPAAAEALEAKIGTPLDGKPWDGTRRYGDTPVNMRVRGSFDTTQGLPNGTAVYSNGQPVSLDSYPTILPVRIVGPMSNTPDDFYEDWPTNRLMTRQLKRTRDPRTSLGHYYWNEAEDDSVSAVVPHADHLEVLDPNWPSHRTASTDGIRYAMPWKDWAPHIQGGCDGCEHTPKSDVNYGEYYIDHPDGSGKQVGDIMPGLNGRSLVQFYHDIGPGGEPEIYISGIHADSNHRHDGVAEALVRRLHEDHPGVRINPGFMTDDGLAFRNRMLEKEPGARGVITTARCLDL